MERAERPLVAPAPSVLAALAAWYARITTRFTPGHRPEYDVYADVAFSDEMERELIRRELHPF
jgi:hypothetical protein